MKVTELRQIEKDGIYDLLFAHKYAKYTETPNRFFLSVREIRPFLSQVSALKRQARYRV
jgi:hypothetical protein